MILTQGIKTPAMEHSPAGKIILMTGMYLLNVGICIHHFSIWLKVLYAIIAGLATVMGFINQWNTLYKAQKSVWIVHKIHGFVAYMIPKRRHGRRKLKFTEKPMKNE